MNEMKQTQLNYARITGTALLLMALLAGFAYGYGISGLFVEGDIAQTFAHHTENPQLFGQAANAFLLILALDILVSITLYHWLKQKGHALVKWMSGLRLLYSAVLAYALYPLFALLCVPEGLQAESLYHALAQFNQGFSAGLIVFGLHLVLLGLAMLKRMEIPKTLGYLALFAGICYSVIHASYWIAPELKSSLATLESILALPMAAGELVLAFWLLIKGKRLT
ncbi:MAG: DUF4386 domain-containing protein [Bacteroidetes bacterium]|nr:MAG: DUF4386 domain-containing protein [Bacteroidota bacterium]